MLSKHIQNVSLSHSTQSRQVQLGKKFLTLAMKPKAILRMHGCVFLSHCVTSLGFRVGNNRVF